MGLGSNSCN